MYLKTQFSEADLKERGIVVGFDARYNSAKWGALTAEIFARHNVRVRLFRDIVPTPYVAFNVRIASSQELLSPSVKRLEGREP